MMNNLFIFILILIALLIGIIVGVCVQKYLFKRKTKKLIYILDTVMRGNYTPDFSSFSEGEFALLTSQLELAVKRTDHIVKELSREKVAIKDSMADISHQLKTPLSALLSYLDLLEQTETNSDRKSQLNNCIYLTERMNELIRMMLELAKLESNSVKLNIAEYDLKEILDNAVFIAKTSRPNVKVNFDLQIPNMVKIRCDSKWISQALVNIIVNAIDYSPNNSVVSILVNKTDSILTIKISDEGGGVSEDELPKLFNRFYRAKSSTAGFGIGLSMAQNIMRLHNGNIRAINEERGLALILSVPELCCAENL